MCSHEIKTNKVMDIVFVILLLKQLFLTQVVSDMQNLLTVGYFGEKVSFYDFIFPRKKKWRFDETLRSRTSVFIDLFNSCKT